MKVLTLLLLTGCLTSTNPPAIQLPTPTPAVPQYKAGDCLQRNSEPDAEAWEETDKSISKVIQVGKHKYLIQFYDVTDKTYYGKDISMWFAGLESITHKVNCPEEKK